MNKNIETYYVGEAPQPLNQLYKKIQLLYQFHNTVMQNSVDASRIINIEDLVGE